MILLLAAILALAPAYLIRFNILGIPTTFLEILVVVFLLITVLKIKKKGLKDLKSLGQINWAAAVFVLAGIISVIISPEKTRALGQLKAFIIEPVLIFYAVIMLTKNSRQLLPAIKALFWASVAISVFGIFQHYSHIWLPVRFWGTGEEVKRIVSVFEYPNALSLYLGPLFVFFSALWLFDHPLSKSRWLSAAGLLAIGIAILLTFSRGAWFATAASLLFILLARFDFKKVILPLLLATAILMLMPPINSRLGLGLSDPSSSAHLDLIKIGVKKVAENPVFGNGLYGFRATQIETGYQGEILNYPHNIILNFWLELGLLGLAAFIWIVFLAFKRYKKSQNILTLGATAFLIVVLVHGLVDAPYFKNDLALLFWFVLTLFYIKE